LVIGSAIDLENVQRRREMLSQRSHLVDELLGELSRGCDGEHERLAVGPHYAHTLIVLLALVEPGHPYTTHSAVD
jgi:hypothetical protein